jgi:glucan 1,3-beta-glucosidase
MEPLSRRLASPLAISLLLPALAAGQALRPLHVAGTSLVDDQGHAVVLRGVNFGNWLVLETYFYGTAFPDERTLWSNLQKRFGAAGMEQVKEAHRSSWITAADFARVRALGLNAVRVPFWSDYSAEGWKWLDFAVQSCEAAGIYCILDFHGLPGGQSVEDHTGASGRNQYWNSPEDHKRADDIWRAIAARYKGRAAIAAFDLMNEPMGAPDDASLVAASGELIDAVRSVDPDRVVAVEDAYRGLDMFPTPSSKGWTNVVFSEHHYATFGDPDPTPQKVQDYIATAFGKADVQQKRLDAPVFVGEWNVMDKSAGGTAMTRYYIDQMGQRGWSWAIWTYKQTKPQGVPADEFWSFYRNESPIALPDFDKDSLADILSKVRALRTENMVLFGPMRDGVEDPNVAALARAQPKVEAARVRLAALDAAPAAGLP